MERVISSHASGVVSGHVHGSADFTLINSDELLYSEKGILTSSITQHEIHREYIYTYDENNDQIAKYFSENNQKTRLFYVLNFTQISDELTEARGSHLCNKDYYQALYQFFLHTEKKFNLTYTVNGPKKDYVARSFYHQEA